MLTYILIIIDILFSCCYVCTKFGFASRLVNMIIREILLARQTRLAKMKICLICSLKIRVKNQIKKKNEKCFLNVLILTIHLGSFQVRKMLDCSYYIATVQKVNKINRSEFLKNTVLN